MKQQLVTGHNKAQAPLKMAPKCLSVSRIAAVLQIMSLTSIVCWHAAGSAFPAYPIVPSRACGHTTSSRCHSRSPDSCQGEAAALPTSAVCQLLPAAAKAPKEGHLQMQCLARSASAARAACSSQWGSGCISCPPLQGHNSGLVRGVVLLTMVRPYRVCIIMKE